MAALAVVLLGACAGPGAGPTDAEAAAARGVAPYRANCAMCHGVQGDGTNVGPPLVHELYEPGHHPDESFQAAVSMGVEPHHWDFGPMPAVGPANGLTTTDVADIVAHVRVMQRAAGIG
jgi:mono/diheme cytochrome c family protein